MTKTFCDICGQPFKDERICFSRKLCVSVDHPDRCAHAPWGTEQHTFADFVAIVTLYRKAEDGTNDRVFGDYCKDCILKIVNNQPLPTDPPSNGNQPS